MKNKTNYSFDNLVKFNLFHINHSLFTCFLLLILIFLIVLSVNSYIIFKDYRHLVLIISYFLVIYFYFFIIEKNVKKNLKNNGKLGIVEYEIKTDCILVKEGNETTKIEYKNIKRVRQDSERIYLYVGKKSAYIFEKNKFENGNAKTFIKLIKERR